jgi:GT2 family glycosyltransferase
LDALIYEGGVSSACRATLECAAAKPTAETELAWRGETLLASFSWAGEQLFFGYIADRSDLKKKFVVEILVDGYVVAIVRADQPAQRLIREVIGDGCYGFSMSLPTDLLREAACVEARLANTGGLVGSPVFLDETFGGSTPVAIGEAQWLGGLRFCGWVENELGSVPLKIEVDGLLIDRVSCTSWRHVGSVESARPVRGFDFHLPHRFADRAVHRLVVVAGQKHTLDGCPLSFIASPAGRESQADQESEAVCRWADRRIVDGAVRSTPFTDYELWRQNLLHFEVAPSAAQIAVLLFGRGDANDTLESLAEQLHRDWAAVSLVLQHGATTFQSEDIRDFLRHDGADCEIVLCALAGSLFAPNALQRIAGTFASRPETTIAYADFELQSPGGSLWPIALSAFDYERMLEQGYCAHLFAVRRSTFERSLASGAANLYRLFNAAFDDDLTATGNVVHLPGPLAILPEFDATAAMSELGDASRQHLQRRNVEASYAPSRGALFPAVRILRRTTRRRTSVVVVGYHRPEQLRACMVALLPTADASDVEIVAVVPESIVARGLDIFDDVARREANVIRVPGPFNYAELLNQGVNAATGEVVCLLDSNVTALDDVWLEEMLSRLSDPDVGAVGALLIASSGVVQHGGMVVGPGFAAAHSFTDRLANDNGYADLLRVAHECSAVDSACLLFARKDYISVGGMDPVQFPMTFGPLDLCLKLRARRKRIVLTPHARLACKPSARRVADQAVLGSAIFEREVRTLRAKWGSSLAVDPYYSPLLSPDFIPYSALTWPPPDLSPRTNYAPTENYILPGF